MSSTSRREPLSAQQRRGRRPPLSTPAVIVISAIGIVVIIAMVVSLARNSPATEPTTEHVAVAGEWRTADDGDSAECTETEARRQLDGILARRDMLTMKSTYAMALEVLGTTSSLRTAEYAYNGSLRSDTNLHGVDSRAYKNLHTFCYLIGNWSCARSERDYAGFMADPEHLVQRYNDTCISVGEGILSPEAATCIIASSKRAQFWSRTCYAEDGTMVVQQYNSTSITYTMTLESRGTAAPEDLELPTTDVRVVTKGG